MDDQTFSYLVSLEGITFKEGENTKWIHAAPLGEYEHPKWGKISITQEKVKNFVDNIKNNVRGQQLDVDYDHKKSAQGGKAAGWVTDAKVMNNGLWLNIEFTPPAQEAIQNKEYKYFSPEFADKWEHPQTKQAYQDVMFGGALTNRPFLKGIQPINLSEFYDDNIDWLDTEEAQEYRDIAVAERKSGSSADFAGKNKSFPIFKPEDVMAAVHSIGRAGPDNYDGETLKRNIISICKRKGGAFMAALPSTWKMSEEVYNLEEFLKKLCETYHIDEPKELTEENVLLAISKKMEDDAKATEEQTKQLIEEALTKKVEETTSTKKFAEDYPEEAKRMEEQDKTIKLGEINANIKTWEESGLPPKFEDAIRELRLELSDDHATKFDTIVSELVKDGLVDKSEIGSVKGADTALTEQFQAAVTKAMSEDDKLSNREAMDKVSSEHPELAKAWVAEGSQ